MEPIYRRSERLIVVLLAMIAVGIAALIVVLLARNGETELSTQTDLTATEVTTEDTSPASGAVVEGLDPGSGSTPEVTPAPLMMTRQEVADEVDRLWPDSNSALLWGVDHVAGWTCLSDSEGGLQGGSVATCGPDPPITEGQYPVVTVLVLDGAGTVAVAESGIQNPRLDPGWMSSNVKSGLNCTQFTETDPGPASIADPLTYFATVLYWFEEGQPSPLMDIDENGIPCETKFTADVVTDLWSGGWFPAAPPTPVGQLIDGPVQEGDVLGVVGVAHDDRLNVRLRPGTAQPVMTTLAPTAEVVATGQVWALPESTWYELQSGPGWVNSRHVAFIAATRAVPPRVWEGWELEAETITQLGQLFIDQAVADLDSPPSITVISVAPTDTEITYDIVGIGDDDQYGSRVRIIARDPSENVEAAFLQIERIEATAFCSQGIGGRDLSDCAGAQVPRR